MNIQDLVLGKQILTSNSDLGLSRVLSSRNVCIPSLSLSRACWMQTCRDRHVLKSPTTARHEIMLEKPCVDDRCQKVQVPTPFGKSAVGCQALSVSSCCNTDKVIKLA